MTSSGQAVDIFQREVRRLASEVLVFGFLAPGLTCFLVFFAYLTRGRERSNPKDFLPWVKSWATDDRTVAGGIGMTLAIAAVAATMFVALMLLDANHQEFSATTHARAAVTVNLFFVTFMAFSSLAWLSALDAFLPERVRGPEFAVASGVALLCSTFASLLPTTWMIHQSVLSSAEKQEKRLLVALGSAAPVPRSGVCGFLMASPWKVIIGFSVATSVLVHIASATLSLTLVSFVTATVLHGFFAANIASDRANRVRVGGRNWRVTVLGVTTWALPMVLYLIAVLIFRFPTGVAFVATSLVAVVVLAVTRTTRRLHLFYLGRSLELVQDTQARQDERIRALAPPAALTPPAPIPPDSGLTARLSRACRAFLQ